MSRYIIVCLIVALLKNCGDCLSWTNVPSNLQYVLLGNNISLSWDYELAPGENSSGFLQIFWAIKERNGWANLAVKSWKSGITILDDEDHISVSKTEKATFTITDVQEKHQGRYRCSLESKVSLEPTYFQLIVLIPSQILWVSESKPFVQNAMCMTLSCVVKGNPVPYVAWFSPSGMMLQNRTSPFDTNLTMNSISREQAGVYTCVASNYYGTATGHTSILSSPAIEAISPVNNKTVNESDSVIFYCNASGFPPPTIEWSKLEDETAVFPAGKELNITRVSRTDSGTYVCTAKNGVYPNATASTVLNVQFPPTVQFISPVNQVLNENSSFSIFCNATGNPLPTIKWLKMGNVISFGEKLEIALAQMKDNGTYRCLASNGIGLNSTVSVGVTIKKLVAPIFIVQPQNKTIEEGQLVVLSCKATGNPIPKLSWFKMGSNGTFLIHGQTLEIAIVKITDKGIYTCVATNGVGRPLSTEAFLNVEFAPKMLFQIQSLTVDEGSTLTLSCDAIGNPRPVFAWRKEENATIDFPSQQRLMFSKIHRTDSGTYVCAAFNSLGNFSGVVATVTVNYKPVDMQISPSRAANVAIEGENLMFNCTATAAPPVIGYRFYHNGNLLQTSSTGTFNLSDAQPSNTGTYTCVPFNRLGNGRPVTFNLTVNPLYYALDLPLILRVSPDESKITVYWKPTIGLNGRPLPTYLLQVNRNNYQQEKKWRNCTTLSTSCKVVVPFHSSYSIRLSIYGYSPFTELNVSTTKVRIILLDVTWTKAFLNKTSASFRTLAETIEDEVWRAFRSRNVTVALKGVAVFNFSMLEDGRVAVQILLTYDESFNLTLTPLDEETKDGYLGNIPIDINFYTPPPNKDNQTGLAVDLMIGIVVPCFIIFLLPFIIILIYRKRKQQRKVETDEGPAKRVDNEDDLKCSAKGGYESSCSDEQLERGQQNGSEVIDGHGSLPNVPMITVATVPKSPENTENDELTHNELTRPRTFEEYRKTSSRPNLHLPTEYADLKKKCGSKERVCTELAWLENNPRPRPLLPIIRPVKRMSPEEKYGITEMLNAQGFGGKDIHKDTLFTRRYSTGTAEMNGTAELPGTM